MSYTLILLHLIVGLAAILSGIITTFMPKYGRAHKYLGWVFITSMLVLGTSSSYIAYTRYIPLSFLNGLLLCYFVLTALQGIKQKPNTTSTLDKVYAVFGVVILCGFSYFSLIVLNAESGKLGGFSAAAYIAFGLVTMIAVLEDMFYLSRHGAKGKYRLLRHLWRMYMPLFMATAAFFLGQAKLFPQQIQASGILFVPVLLVMITWGYWLHRIPFRGKMPKPSTASSK